MRCELWLSNSKSSAFSTSPVVTSTLSPLSLFCLHAHSQIMFDKFIFTLYLYLHDFLYVKITLYF